MDVRWKPDSLTSLEVCEHNVSRLQPGLNQAFVGDAEGPCDPGEAMVMGGRRFLTLCACGGELGGLAAPHRCRGGGGQRCAGVAGAAACSGCYRAQVILVEKQIMPCVAWM